MDIVVAETSENLEKLRSLIASYLTLKNAGYIVEPLNATALRKKARCTVCGKNPKKRLRPPKADKDKADTRPGEASTSEPAQTAEEEEADEEDDQAVELDDDTKHKGTEKAEVIIVDQCWWHPLLYQRGQFQCCGKNTFSAGCQSRPMHTPEPTDTALFASRWTFYATPPEPAALQAVALDCEMGTGMNGEYELIKLSLVDYFSGTTLIDRLVFPRAPLRHCNTRWSGVTMGDLHQARRSGRAIFGRDKAREEIWRFVGPKTILIVHGGTGDLTVLRWMHHCVIDTGIVEKRQKVRAEGNAGSLKKLSELRLGILVQQGRGHCSLEDARAARVLAHWYAEHGEWGGQENEKGEWEEDVIVQGPELTELEVPTVELASMNVSE